MVILRSKSAVVGTFKVVVTILITLSLVVLAGVMVFDRLDPFGTKTVDRSGPTMLERIRTLEEFTAAEATFTQDVDLETDTKFLPGFVSGQRVVAIVTGAVRATADLGSLDEKAISVDEESSTIEITLPEPELSDAEIDEKSARIIARDRGLVDRVDDFFAANPTEDGPVFEAAAERLDKAAADSDLLERARGNTERWLQTFLGAAGFDTVVVSWPSS